MKFLKWFVWLLTGVILCSALSMSHLTGSNFFTENFYKTKEILDCEQIYYRDNGLIQDGYWNITEEEYANYLKFGNQNKRWKYLCIDIDESSKNNISVYIDYCNFEKSALPLLRQEVVFKPGKNVIKIDCKEKFSGVWINIPNEKGTCFHVKSVQVRKSKPIQNFKSRFLKRLPIIFIAYIFVSIYIYMFKINQFFNKIIEKLIKIIIQIFEKINLIVYKYLHQIPIHIIKCIRILLFLWLLVYFNLSNIKLVFEHKNNLRVIILSTTIFLIAITLVTDKIRHQKWNNLLVKCWIVYNLLVIISDIFIKKTLMYQGYILFFIFGFLIFNLNNQKNIKNFFREICVSVHIYFIIVVLCCFMFRPDVYLRYQGTFSNPVTFGTYVSIIFAIATVELVNLFKANKFHKMSIFYIIEFLISIFFVWKTQSRCALLAVISILFVSFIIYFITLKHLKIKKYLILLGILIVLFVIPVFNVSNYIVNKLPLMMGTMITLKNDVYKPNDKENIKEKDILINYIKPNIVYAKEEKNYILQKFTISSIEIFTSGRSRFWKSYFRKMNLFGHYGYLKIDGIKKHPHLSLLMIPYRYGVFTIIPYFMIILLSLYKSIQYIINKYKKLNYMSQYLVLPFFIIIIFLCASLLDVAEYFFSGFIWTIFNIMYGIFFSDSD